MKRTPVVVALSAIFLLFLPACDSSSDNETPSQAGTFEATVEGDVNDELSGTATSSGTETGWGLVLGSTGAPKSQSGEAVNGTNDVITFVRINGTRPGDGTYSVLALPSEESDDFFGSVMVDGIAWSGATGNLVITSSSSTRVRGTFGLTATQGDESITIEGSFHSINLDNAEGF